VTLGPFVGRQEEMRFLASQLELTRRNGRLALVVGEAGIGKSRLLQEFAARGRRRAEFLVGRGSPLSTSIPFSILVEALESRLRRLPAARLLEIAGRRLPDLAYLLPSFAVALGRAEAAPHITPRYTGGGCRIESTPLSLRR
jgi:hypothetical protein